MKRPFFLGGKLPTGQAGGVKSKTFAGKDERDIENQILRWRANNPRMAVKKIHPFKRADPVERPL
jgi:hypothetical protein